MGCPTPAHRCFARRGLGRHLFRGITSPRRRSFYRLCGTCVKPGDRVGLFSANRPEWHTADFAIPAPACHRSRLLPRIRRAHDLHPEALRRQSDFCRGRHAIAEASPVRKELPELEQIVVADAGPDVPTECLRYETSSPVRAPPMFPPTLAALHRFSRANSLPSSTRRAPPASPRASCSRIATSAQMSPIWATTSAGFPRMTSRFSFLRSPMSMAGRLDYIYIFQGAALAYVESVDTVAQALVRGPPHRHGRRPALLREIYARLVEQGSRNRREASNF